MLNLDPNTDGEGRLLFIIRHSPLYHHYVCCCLCTRQETRQKNDTLSEHVNLYVQQVLYDLFVHKDCSQVEGRLDGQRYARTCSRQ